MRIDILTLFPEAVRPLMEASILRRAAKKGLVEIHCVQIRDFTDNKQRQVDDYPYGGGWGCVMMAQPLKACLEHVEAEAGSGLRRRVVYMSPQGTCFDQNHARRLASEYDHLVLICGHYEGVDERFIERCCDEELSLGDFVLTGGEIPAMAVADSVCRLLPGVLSDPACYEDESHWDGLLEYPQYTRPDVWEGMAVPEVLRTGRHADVAAWRREQQIVRTKERRPDLFAVFRPETKEDKRTVDRLLGREKLTYDCRKTTDEDIPTLLSIAAEGSAYLREQGVHQWQDGFPNAETFADDIRAGACWLFTHSGESAGCVSLCFGHAPYYDNIDGAWQTEGTVYGVIHRVAVRAAYRGRGLVSEMFQLCEDLAQGRGCLSVRIDTHEHNKPMRHVLERRGYLYCGIIELPNTIERDPRRVCYEKVFQ